MKTNILKLIINSTCIPAVKLGEYYNQLGRATDDESCAREYVKDCLCSTVREKTDDMRMRKMNSMLENFGGYPIADIIGDDAVILSVIDDKTGKITLPEPIQAKLGDRDTIYVTTVVKDGILSGIFAAFGAEYADNTDGTSTVENPAQAFSYVYSLHDDAKYEFMFIVDSELYATYHMQTRLEVETLAQVGRGLEMKDVKIKTNSGERPAKLFTVYR